MLQILAQLLIYTKQFQEALEGALCIFVRKYHLYLPEAVFQSAAIYLFYKRISLVFFAALFFLHDTHYDIQITVKCSKSIK